MTPTSTAVRALLLVKVAKQQAPFFPEGKPKFSLPDLGPKGMPDAPWNKAKTGETFQIRPRDMFEPYYQNTPGGMSMALHAAQRQIRNISDRRGPVPTRGKAFKQKSPQPPVYKPDLNNIDKSIPVETEQPFQDYYSRQGPKIGWSGTAAPLDKLKGILEFTDRALSNPSSMVEKLQSNHMTANSFEEYFSNPHSVLEHEAGHAAIERPKSDTSSVLLPRYADPKVNESESFLSSPEDTHGYYSVRAEEDQGMARTKRETAALTGRRVDRPADYKQLLQEINPADQNETAFEERIKHYSPEGQRYWRYLRHNGLNHPDYYQRAVERGAARMPMMVRLQKLKQLAQMLA